MRIQISKIIRYYIMSILIIGGILSPATAISKDLSAIDFNGDLIGKVIPDGSVVDSENYVIGHITAEGLILNDDNNLIGGIVPQGVVIAIDNSILGKVNNDGSVMADNDTLVGKVLPNGLVINFNYEVIGGVILPGLIYNDKGEVSGRVAGDGKFYNLSGENNGYITASGYVFATSSSQGNKTELVGRLLPSNKVISSVGKFLGSVSPNGNIIDLKKQTIGKIHANGFAYNANNMAIGHVVENGYAFNFDGSYLGTVSYNGEIIKNGQVIAQTIFGNRVISKDGSVIGFTIDMSATVNDFNGKYIGRITLNGEIVKEREVIGKIGASGSVINSKGDVIGLINEVGPVYDYLGQLRGNATINGSVLSLDGQKMGFMQKDRALSVKQKEIGRTLKNYFNFDNNNNFIGMSGAGTELLYDGRKYIISPYGYVFDENENIDGRNYKLSAIYSARGNVLTNILSNGRVENLAINDKVKLTGAGFLIDKDNNLLGKDISGIYATDFSGRSLGYINPTNLIIDNKNNNYAKILPDKKIISINDKETKVLGAAGETSISLSINGDYLGINTEEGLVKKSGEIIGRISSSQEIIDNQGALYGKTQPFGVVTDTNCKYLGVISDNGDVRTTKGGYIGMILTNGQVINDTEDVIGHIINPQSVTNENGNILGVENSLGVVFDYKNQNLGCQGLDGKIRNAQKEIVGQKIEYVPVMNFKSEIIGTIGFNGKVISEEGKDIGFVSADGNVKSIDDKEPIGLPFKYKVAFNNDNIYVGRVNERGDVISDGNEVVGKVLYTGAVQLSDGQTGFALYDLYVYDNEGKTVGYIAKNGRIYSVMNGIKGSMYEGFVLDKKQNLIARGSRDYNIRNSSQQVIGTLNLDGKVINTKNIEVGELADNGEIKDSRGNIIASALPLQYYRSITKEKAMTTNDQQIEDNKKDGIDQSFGTQEIEGEFSENTLYEEDDDETNNTEENQRNIVGIAIKPGGQYIGEITDENQVIDEEGQKIAEIDAEGNIVTPKGETVGTFDPQEATKPVVTKRDDWIKAVLPGVAVSPYDNTDTVSHVGADGGIGPRGRYNPRRAAIINSLQNERRKTISGKVISNGGDIDSYTGWQERWTNFSYQISSLRVDMSNMITADKPIPAVLARSLISLGGAPVTAIVERNIYGDAGRNIIIPAGSRILGGMNDVNENERFDGNSGGVKLNIEWQRIIRPDGIAFNISSAQVGDAEGRGGGALGYVDEQIVKKYAMPLIGTLATSAMAYMMAANNDATGEVETSKQQAANDARQNFIDKMDEILGKIIESKEEIQPVTYVPAGTRIIIYPMTDLWLRTTKDVKKGVEGGLDTEKRDILLDEKEGKKAEVQNQNNNNNGALLDENQQGNGNNQNGNNNANKSVGAMPPPSADGTGATVPDEEDEELDLFD